MLMLLIISLLPIFYASFFIHPVMDDLNFSAGVHSAICSGASLFEVLKKAFSTVSNNYFGWQGTFSAIFLFAFQPAVFSEELYFVTTFVMILSVSLSTFFLIDTLLVHCFNADRAYSILISSAVLFCSFQFVVNIPEAFFWWNGSVYYTFFYSLSLILFSLLIRMVVTEKKRSICFCVSVFLAFMIGGGNYSTALFTACLMVLALFFLTRLHAEKLWQFYFIFIVLMLCFAINASAPGNSVRAAYFTQYNPVEAIAASIYHSFLCIGEYTRLPQVILFIFVSPFVYSIASKLDFDFKFPLIVIVLAFLCFATQLTPPLYAMRMIGAGRQQNMYYYAYYLMMLFDIFYLSGWAAKTGMVKIDFDAFCRAKIVVPTCIILTLFFITSGVAMGLDNLASIKVLKAIDSGEAWQYEQEYMEIVEQIKNGEENIQDIYTCPANVFYRIGFDDTNANTVVSYYSVEYPK